MNNKVNLQDLARALSVELDMPRRDAEDFARAAFEVIQEGVATDGIVKIKGLGTFKTTAVESRESVDVNTGDRIMIDGHNRITFTPANSLRDQVNKPFADFETTILADGTATEEMEYTVADEPIADEQTSRRADEPSVADEPTVPEPVEPEPVEPEPVSEPEPEPEQQPVNQSAGVQHVEEMVVNQQFVEHQTIQQVISSALDKELEKRRREKSSWGRVVAWVLLVLVLMAASFAGGYFYAKGMLVLPVRQSAPAVKQPAPAIEKPKPAPKKPAAKKPEPEKQEPTAEELAKDYPQLDGGEYWIVGTKEEHVIERGDNVYMLARKVYGDKELARYIILYNNIKDPDKILLGFPIKLPELVRRDAETLGN